MKNKCISRSEIKREIKKSIDFYKSCVKCERCGHSIPIGKRDKVLCEHCGKYIFKDKKTEFIYRIGVLI